MSDFTDSHPLEREIFYRAFEIEDLAARTAYLDEACGDDTHLRSRMDALFGVADRPDLFEPQPTVRGVIQGITHGEAADQIPTEKRQPHEFQSGDSITLIGKYELVHEIARGGMGIVYKACQQKLNRIVALKLIRDANLMTPDEITRFRMEAEFAAALDHPNIVPIYEVDEHEGHCWFSMKLIEGGPVTYEMFGDGDTKAAVRTILKITRAVQAAHGHGILHRDIKPGNILIDKEGEPHLTDFGIAKFSETGTDLTLTGEILGTPLYMSPEQARGERGNVSVSTDVYSLGAVLYELVSGQRLFKGDTSFSIINQVLEEIPRPIRSLKPDIDRDLDTIVMKCLEKEPTARYSSAGALGDDLEAWLKGEPISARAVSPSERFWKWTRRKPVHAALLLVGTLFALVLAIGGPIVAVQQSNLKVIADRRAEQLRQGLYIARMNLASTALAENRGSERIAAFLQMTDREEGKTDLRNWEWFYFKSLLSDVVISQESPWKGVRWSPDGTKFLTGVGRSGDVGLWDGKSGTLIKKYSGVRSGQVESLDWSPDGSRFATAGSDHTARIWDTETGEVLHTLQAVNPKKVAWSPNGIFVATYGIEPTTKIKIWDPDTGKLIREFESDNMRSNCLAWSPDSLRLVSASLDGAVQIWDVKTGRIVLNRQGFRSPATALDWSHDGMSIALANRGEYLFIMDPESGKERKAIFLGERGNEALRWSHDDRFLAVGGNSETVHVWDVSTGNEVKTLRGLSTKADDIDWSLDDRFLAAVGRGLRVWDLKPASPMRRIELEDDTAYSARESHNGKYLAVAPRNNYVSLYDRITLEKIRDLKQDKWMSALDWSPVQNRLASGGVNTDLCIWDPDSGELVKKIATKETFIHEIAWSPDGGRMAIGESGNLVVFDTETWKPVLDVPSRNTTATIDGLAWSPDGRGIAIGGQNAKTGVYDSETGALIHLFPAGGLRILSIAWHPNGEYIAVGYDSSEVVVWSMKTLSEVARLPGHTRGVQSLAFNPDGTRLATGGGGEAVRVWDTESWEELIALRDGNGEIRTVSWSADGKRIVSDCLNGKVLIWDASLGYESE